MLVMRPKCPQSGPVMMITSETSVIAAIGLVVVVTVESGEAMVSCKNGLIFGLTFWVAGRGRGGYDRGNRNGSFSDRGGNYNDRNRSGYNDRSGGYGDRGGYRNDRSGGWRDQGGFNNRARSKFINS